MRNVDIKGSIRSSLELMLWLIVAIAPIGYLDEALSFIVIGLFVLSAGVLTVMALRQKPRREAERYRRKPLLDPRQNIGLMPIAVTGMLVSYASDCMSSFWGWIVFTMLGLLSIYWWYSDRQKKISARKPKEDDRMP